MLPCILSGNRFLRNPDVVVREDGCSFAASSFSFYNAFVSDKFFSAIFMSSVVTGLFVMVLIRSIALKCLLNGVPKAWYKSRAPPGSLELPLSIKTLFSSTVLNSWTHRGGCKKHLIGLRVESNYACLGLVDEIGRWCEPCPFGLIHIRISSSGLQICCDCAVANVSVLVSDNEEDAAACAWLCWALLIAQLYWCRIASCSALILVLALCRWTSLFCVSERVVQWSHICFVSPTCLWLGVW